jgi:hypothetical protein
MPAIEIGLGGPEPGIGLGAEAMHTQAICHSRRSGTTYPSTDCKPSRIAGVTLAATYVVSAYTGQCLVSAIHETISGMCRREMVSIVRV